jgi:low affinity Fe/Cu permease
MPEGRTRTSNAFERFAQSMTRWTGSTGTFLTAFSVVMAWGATGPLFGYSDTWQLVINTGTTIVTFLMVFLIQRTQNKDALAMHLKLNELVAAKKGASNRLLNAEDLTEEELHTLHRHYARLVELARGETTVRESHSVEEAEERHRVKRQGPGPVAGS